MQTGINNAQLQANSYAAGIVKTFSEARLPPRIDTLFNELINLFGAAFGAGFDADQIGFLRGLVGNAARRARALVDSLDTGLMRGDADASNSHIWDYLKGGQLASPTQPADATAINNWLQTI
ncbi:hypothetical protein GP486_002436 [Trichoglossum hirsutum]|uniref:Uncharacterized protein n=1 Tax=Trichoglossum hirsutum TaxID=265104 RepID=A0A9P8RS36_9PEZI|nr:hypothetical protein GP486_002436 [Trichoglossum hirsutum]